MALGAGSAESRGLEDPAADPLDLDDANVFPMVVVEHEADVGSWVGADSYVVHREDAALAVGMPREVRTLVLVLALEPTLAERRAENVETTEVGCLVVQAMFDQLADTHSCLRCTGQMHLV